MDHRRAFLARSAVGLAALPFAARAAGGALVTVAPESSADASSPSQASAATTSADPSWLFAPLSAGSELGLGWMYARAFAPRDGAITVNLVHRDGRAARVDLCHLAGAARGPAHSAMCDFIVMDGGDGAAAMDESLGRALFRLAAVVTDNEAEHPDAVSGLLALEPHADRVWKHRDAMASAARRLTPGVEDPA